MPRKTLLEVVNLYMTKTNGFRVQSIYDSEESESVATIAEEVFYHIVDKAPDIQFTESIITLNSPGLATSPNYLLLPTSVSSLINSEVKYNNTDTANGLTHNYLGVKYLEPSEFLDLVSLNTNKLTNTVEVSDPVTGATYLVQNNKHPQYFTSFGGEYLAFDSFDADESATLLSSNSLVLVSGQPVFILEDDFYPPLPDKLFSIYQDGVVAEASEALRQEPMPTVRRRYQAEMAKLQKTNKRVGYKTSTHTSYGRR